MKNRFTIIIFLLFCQLDAFAQNGVSKYNFEIGSIASDSMALVEFNLSTQGELWKNKWDFNTPISTWYGVELNAEGRVFCIDLDGDPNCSAMRYGGNHLHGNLPDWQLPFLEHLFLSSNKLDGEIPNFSGTPYLRTLQLSANRLEGSIPDFENLRNLVKLDLEYNSLSGIIPDFENLPSLASLYLGHNNFLGPVPEFSNSLSLKQIYIDHNQLNECPERFDHLMELTQFILCENQLKGTIPSFEDNLNLSLLDLSYNDFTGCFTTKKYAHIANLNLSENRLSNCDEEEVFIPNGISPNGDGVNDYFEIVIPYSKKTSSQIELIILDQTSRIVYHKKDYENDWDGTYLGNGSRLEQGTYFYQLIINNQENRSGWILIRY